MASYDVPVVSQSVISDTEFFRTVVERRNGMIIDHIVDLQARKLALQLRLQQDNYVPTPAGLVKDVTRVT